MESSAGVVLDYLLSAWKDSLSRAHLAQWWNSRFPTFADPVKLGGTAGILGGLDCYF